MATWQRWILTLTEIEYIDLLRDLGVGAGLAVNSSYVLRVGPKSLRLYLHHNQRGVFFYAMLSDSHLYPDMLWRRLDNRRYERVFSVVPWPGMEREALSSRIRRIDRDRDENDGRKLTYLHYLGQKA